MAKFLVVDVPECTRVEDVLRDVARDIERKNRPTVHTTCRCETRREWRPEPTFAPTPRGEKRFGAEFAIDEPRWEDYSWDKKWQWKSDHDAYDNFVSAGNDCVARQMARPEGVVAHRCNAVRKRIEDGPAIGLDLIGETHGDGEWRTRCVCEDFWY